jgi:hypothetical protein
MYFINVESAVFVISIPVALLDMIEETAVPCPYNIILSRETARAVS